MVIFKTLKMEGFGCYKNFTRFVFNEPGINVITGDNGQGKTTIFNALYWVLYGKNLKGNSEIATWEHLRGEDWVGTMVSLTFFKGKVKYKIVRCKDYQLMVDGVKGKDKLFVYKDGIDVNVRDKRSTQKKIDQILGFGPDIFVNAIMFPQKGKRFIEEPGPKKKEILEQAFNLDWITLIASELKETRKDIQSEVRVLLEGVNSKVAAIDSIEEALDEVYLAKKNFERRRELKLQELREEKKEAEAGQEALDYDPKMKTVIEARNHDIATQIIELQNKPSVKAAEEAKDQKATIVAQLENLVSQLKTTKNSLALAAESEICPTCGQEMGKEEHKAHLNELNALRVKLISDKTNLENQLLAVEDKIKSGKENLLLIDAYDLELQANLKKVGELDKAAIRYENFEKTITRITKDIKEEKAKVFEDTSTTLKEKLKNLKVYVKAQRKELRKANRRLELHNWAISGPFSNNGLKTFLFDILLDKLNDRLEFYSDFTGFLVQLEIISTGQRENIEAIITRDGYPVQYDDLSAGEQQITNLVLGFAQSDILVKENPTNLWAGDEILESLDRHNVEKVSNFLQTVFSPERAIFIITHQEKFRPSGANVIRINRDSDEF